MFMLEEKSLTESFTGFLSHFAIKKDTENNSFPTACDVITETPSKADKRQTQKILTDLNVDHHNQEHTKSEEEIAVEVSDLAPPPFIPLCNTTYQHPLHAMCVKSLSLKHFGL